MRTLFRLIGRFGGHRRFIASRDGNVAHTFSLVLVPAIYLLGAALDSTQAHRKQSQLDAAADAAAIAAVTSAMMAQSVSATIAAQNIFNATGSLG